jgi:hypothetical protein
MERREQLELLILPLITRHLTPKIIQTAVKVKEIQSTVKLLEYSHKISLLEIIHCIIKIDLKQLEFLVII